MDDLAGLVQEQDKQLGPEVEATAVHGTEEKLPVPADQKDKIMHVRYTFDDCVLFASDGGGMYPELKKGNSFHLSVYLPDKDNAKSAFDALSAGGNVTMPMQEVFWGGGFGSFIDKFGVSWMVSCP